MNLIALFFLLLPVTYEAPKVEYIYAEFTMYTNSPEETDDTPDIMADGTMVRAHSIACPRRYPFGVVVEVEKKQYVCRDRMNKKHDGFDIWTPDKKVAKAFGRKYLPAIIR